MLDKVKLALRISHSYLDEDIKDTIDSARAEIVRSGVSSSKAVDDDPLIAEAIKTYCKYVYASDSKLAEGYYKSFEYQLDNMRKTAEYRDGDLNV